MIYLIFTGLLGIFTMVSLFFIITAYFIYSTADNRINSFLGLCFIFIPFAKLVICIITLCIRIICDNIEGSLFIAPYFVQILLEILQITVICTLIGSTRPNDSAYKGLLDRKIC